MFPELAVPRRNLLDESSLSHPEKSVTGLFLRGGYFSFIKASVLEQTDGQVPRKA